MSSLFLLFANSIYVSTKIMQTSGKRACSYFPECSLSYTKITQGESSSKTGKLRFTGLDIAEPKLIFYKDNANEWKESLLLLSRVQLILYKDSPNPRIVSVPDSENIRRTLFF
jgi:hypothetical protein